MSQAAPPYADLMIHNFIATLKISNYKNIVYFVAQVKTIIHEGYLQIIFLKNPTFQHYFMVILKNLTYQQISH